MSKFFINRPIVAMVISIVMVIVGAVAIAGLPVALFPQSPVQPLTIVTIVGSCGHWPPCRRGEVEHEEHGWALMELLHSVAFIEGYGSPQLVVRVKVKPFSATAKGKALKRLLQRVACEKRGGRRGMPAQGTKAGFVLPILLLRTNRLPEGANWAYELKLDGCRAIAVKNDGKVHLRSRNNKDFNAAYAAIAKALAHLPDETVVDGEIVAIVLVGQVEYGSFYRCLQQSEMTIIPPTKPTKRAA
jgi:hypothetical protein